jgi:ADP-L-glycero-D-manno-heptose 6-epimerase
MRIAVTGALGFIGHELIDRLINDGHEVIAVDYCKYLIRWYESERFPIMRELYRILPNCHAVVEPDEFVSGLGTKYKPRVVVHAGAVVDTKDLGSSHLYDTNVTYTELLTEACERIGTHLVFISSAATYGSEGFPNNPYGLSKALGEKIVGRMNTVCSLSLRLFNVFGRYEHHKGEMASVPWKMAQVFERDEKFKLHSPHAERDFVPSKAVVEAIVHMIDEVVAPGASYRHRIYDVGTGTPTSFSTLADMIADSKRWGTKALPIELIEMPPELEGRYQTFTKAGAHDVPIVSAGIDFKRLNTPQGILEAYGVDKR